ncbi:MAG: DUF2267 domain-containing protein [Candidatus Saccharimonadales bacterium]
MGALMGFRELVKKVQLYSGFSDRESQDALEMMVTSLAERLTDEERLDFASQLPIELQMLAAAAEPVPKSEKKDILGEFMKVQGIDESHAKKQIYSSWKAIKDAISEGELKDIRSQLPNTTVAFLH